MNALYDQSSDDDYDHTELTEEEREMLEAYQEKIKHDAGKYESENTGKRKKRVKK